MSNFESDLQKKTYVQRCVSFGERRVEKSVIEKVFNSRERVFIPSYSGSLGDRKASSCSLIMCF
jgi:hypothetical protein